MIHHELPRQPPTPSPYPELQGRPTAAGPIALGVGLIAAFAYLVLYSIGAGDPGGHVSCGAGIADPGSGPTYFAIAIIVAVIGGLAGLVAAAGLHGAGRVVGILLVLAALGAAPLAWLCWALSSAPCGMY
jgi:hypothetical protein